MRSSKAARWFAHKTFGFWQALGLHVVPNHYYEPVPDTRDLPASLWNAQTAAAGIDLQLRSQLELISRLARYRDEFDAFVQTEPTPGTYFAGNPSFGPIDAALYYGLLRERQPSRVVEIGAGYSTIVAAAALAKNQKPAELIVIEPYPPAWLKTLKGVTKHLVKPVQEVSLETFTQLTKGDVLFIDSSHVLKTGSDVQFEVLEILPRLQPGVAVHIHDIFLPNEYPLEWLKQQKRFWNEQYIVQAFLAGNDHFEIRWLSNSMHKQHSQRLAELTNYYDPKQQPGSLWIERIS